MSDLLVLILSCDKYSDLWNAQDYLYNLYWPNSKFKRYILTDKKRDIEFKSFTLYATDDNYVMTQRLEFFLNKRNEDYIFITLDDYFLCNKVDENVFEEVVSKMKKDNIGYVRLFKYPKCKNFYYDESFCAIKYDKNYDVNLYPGIWSRKLLLELAKTKSEIWNFEVGLTAKLFKLNIISLFYNGSPFRFIDGVRKGQLLPSANKFLIKFGFALDRKKMNLFKAIWLNLLFHIKEFMPKRIYKISKSIAKKLGARFYSE